MDLTNIKWENGFSALNPDSIPPESVLLPYSKPLLFPESTRNTLVICLHGWRASPYEAIPIAKAVQSKGFAASVPLLPGHGIKDLNFAKKIFSEVKYTDWIRAVKFEIEMARKSYDHVFIYGQSMGGALAMLMAEEQLVEACAVTAPAIKLVWQSRLFIRLLGGFNIFDKDEEETSFFNEGYSFRSIRSARELRRLGDVVRKNLSQIQCPLLECHSELDDTILPSVAHLIERNVSGPVQIRWFNRSGHTMPLDVEKNAILEAIQSFFVEVNENLMN
ncbi:MAG: alpha/beta fold hydrolase [Candidatus Lokiarchaeota archaeon]|nr:alpha/beta fold hydrolase [Candidatus Harpocratesius repetitus]